MTIHPNPDHQLTKYHQLESDLFVAGLLDEDDFAEMAALGFKTIVSICPDDEVEGQLNSSKAEQLANRHGLNFHYLPVIGFEATLDQHVAAFAKIRQNAEGPSLFYCRSGTRSTILWAQNAIANTGLDAVLEIAANAGFDLSQIKDLLIERVSKTRAVA